VRREICNTLRQDFRGLAAHHTRSSTLAALEFLEISIDSKFSASKSRDTVPLSITLIYDAVHNVAKIGSTC